MRTPDMFTHIGQLICPEGVRGPAVYLQYNLTPGNKSIKQDRQGAGILQRPLENYQNPTRSVHKL